MLFHRTLGIVLATVLMLYAALGLYANLAPSAALARFAPLDGDALASRAMDLAEQALERPALDASARRAESLAAQAAITGTLEISPIRPALWLALARLKAQMNQPIVPALKMSYFTGVVPPELALPRLELVTTTEAAADEEIRLLAPSDIRTALQGGSRFEAPLLQIYVQASREGKALLLEATQAINPKFNALLRRY